MLDLRQSVVVDDLGLLLWRTHDFAEGGLHIGEIPIQSVSSVTVSKDQSERVSSVQAIEVLLLSLEVLKEGFHVATLGNSLI